MTFLKGHKGFSQAQINEKQEAGFGAEIKKLALFQPEIYIKVVLKPAQHTESAIAGVSIVASSNLFQKRNSMTNVCLIEINFCKNHAKCIALKIYIDTKYLVGNWRNLKRECRKYPHDNGKMLTTFYKVFSYWKPWTEKNEAPCSELQGIKRNCAEANPPSLYELRRGRLAILSSSSLWRRLTCRAEASGED